MAWRNARNYKVNREHVKIIVFDEQATYFFIHGGESDGVGVYGSCVDGGRSGSFG